MTAPIAPTPIDLLPVGPRPTDTPSEFDAKAFPAIEAQEAMIPQINSAISTTYTNAVSASESAVSASESAVSASENATIAAQVADVVVTARSQVVEIDNYWRPLQLGPKPAFPAMDNQGNPLTAGAEFFHTGLKATYKWDGATWVVGTNVTAGVSQVNSKTGVVTLTPDDVGQSFTAEELQLTGNSRKWLTASVFQDAVFALASTPRALHFYTTNTTYTVPLGVSYVRFYIGGRGGDGGGGGAADDRRSGGGGGGFAFGDILVRTGDVVSLEFASGVATAKLNGVVMGTANDGGNGVATYPGGAEGGVGGTASIHSSVVNGGAYPGGKGGGAGSGGSSGGGGSCGSPLGAGFQGGETTVSAAGGAGIGGRGASPGGGGAGEAGGTTYGGGSGPDGASRGVSNYFADPLLRHAVGPRTVGNATDGYAGCGGNGGSGPGAGGDFGGGGGGTTSSVAGGAGGLMGGGGGSRSRNGGNGGYGGGGGGGTTGGTGGAAFGFLYVPVARDGGDSLEMAYWRNTGERLEPYIDRQEVFANEDVLILNDVQP